MSSQQPSHQELVFPDSELERRRAALTALMAERNLDVVMLTNPISTYYLTGYHTFAVRQFQAYIFARDGRDAFLAWELELPNVKFKSSIDRLVLYRTGEDKIAVAVKLLRQVAPQAKTIGLESDGLYVTADQFRELHSRIASVGEPTLLGRFIKKLITIKSSLELDYLRQSARITDAAMRVAMSAVAPGRTDNDVAAAAVEALVREGGEYTCSFPIVTAGRRSGVPHTTFCRNPINTGDVVVLELGAPFERYNTALMRTVFVGQPPGGALELARACTACLDEVLRLAGPGVRSRDIAASAKAYLPLERDDIVFHNVYGYSVGIGFPPTWADDASLEITESSDFVLQPGMVFHTTISPRVFVRYGVAVSETWAVTEDGVEVLTKCHRGFAVV